MKTCSRHALIPGAMLTLLLLLESPVAHGVENAPGAWAIFSTTDSFSEGGRWRYWFDGQARYFDIGTGFNQWLARPAVGYELDNGLRIWLGYAHLRTRGRSGSVFDENRFFQQVDWRAPEWHGGSLALRARLLQRSVDIGEDTSLLLRVMARYDYPLSNGRTFIFSAEPFFDLRDSDWGGKRGFRQSRVFAGVGFPVGDHWTFETGYMNQYVVLDNAANRSNHLATINFRYRR